MFPLVFDVWRKISMINLSDIHFHSIKKIMIAKVTDVITVTNLKIEKN